MLLEKIAVRTLRWMVLVGTVSVAAVHTSFAATYTVAPAPAGNDANPGSEAAPWRTLQRAADVVTAGDTVQVLDGDYQGFDLRRSGAAGNPIIFRAAGANVRITADNPRTPDGINVENAAHVVIDGFIADGRTRAGVRAVVAAFITIRNCRLGYNGRWGILTGFVDDLVVEDNETHHSVAEHGIYAGNSGDRPVIRRNWVHDNRANGIHINADASQGGDGVISGALVEGNVIHGNGVGGGSGINMDGVIDSIVRNNLLYDNHASGISLYRIDGAGGATNNLVVNNTIIQASDGRWCVNISGGSTGNRVRNNILYTTHSFRGVISIDAASRPGFVSDFNSLRSRFSIDGGDTVITSLAAWQALGYDLHSFAALPSEHFVAPGADFHLLASSPAIDAGTAIEAPAADLDGTARPQGAGIDLGAFERGGDPTPTPTPTPTSTAPPAATRTATPTATRTASATPTASPASPPVAIRGAVRSQRGDHPVAGVTMRLTGPALHTAVSDASGAYALSGVPDGAWRLEPGKLGGRGAAVSALDAAWVLQHVAELRALDAEQMLACDVTASGGLSALDATRILQLAVGLLPQLPAAEACGSDWLFVPTGGGAPPLLGGGACTPGARTYAALRADLDGQDFRALPIGDCTGNWQPPSAAAARRMARPAVRVSAARRAGGRVRLALQIAHRAPLQALELALATAPGTRVERVRSALAARGGRLAAHVDAGGLLRLAFAASRPLRPGRRAAFVLDLSGYAAAPAVRLVRVSGE